MNTLLSSRLEIRAARIEEKRALEELQLRASLQNPGDRAHLEANPDAISIPEDQIEKSLVFVAELNGLVVGFAALETGSVNTIELDGLFVEPAHWRSGTGRALVDHAAAVARKLGYQELAVIANPHALGFYHSCQFTEVGTAETRFGPAVRMTRTL